MVSTASRSNSVLALSGLQLVGMAFPPAGFLGGSVAALYCFHYAPAAVAPVLLAAAALVTGVFWALTALGDGAGVPVGMLLALGVQWLAIALFVGVWRKVSLSLALQTLGVVVLVALAVAHLLVNDVAQAWRERVEAFLSLSVADLDPETGAVLEGMLVLMTGLTLAGLAASLTLCSMFGRWMQTLRGERGPFRAEALELSLGVILTTVFAATLVMWGVSGEAVWGEAAIALSPLFFVQGVATCHRLVITFAANAKPWLVALYVALFLAVLLDLRILAMIMVLGALENFVKLRRRCLRAKDGEMPKA